MHIAIVGPIGTDDIRAFLTAPPAALPLGYPGAPLLSSLIGQLIKNGHTVSAITLSKDLPLDSGNHISVIGRNFSITYCPMRPKAWGLNGLKLGRIVDLFAFEKYALTLAIKKMKPDIVHAHWAYEFGSAALNSGFPTVITSHDSPLDIARISKKEKLTVSGYRWLRAFIGRTVLRSARNITTVSPYLKQRIQALTTSEVLVIPNPVDDLVSSLAASKTHTTCPKIAMVCNGWDARKNPEPGLMAFSQLLKDMPGATMHLYGNDFGSGQSAENWCKTKGIEKGMCFHGPVPHKQLLIALAQHDLLLHTSIEESFGMVIAEAMALGLPVVAGQSSGAVPWVMNSCGALCDVTDSKDIYKSLHKALSASNYAFYSKKGIENISSRFTAQKITNEYMEIYEIVIKNQKILKTAEE